MQAAYALLMSAAAGVPNPGFYQPIPETNSLTVDLASIQQVVPPFQAAAHDEIRWGLSSHYSPADPVSLRIRYDRIRASWSDGAIEQGSGDMELGSAGRLLAVKGVELWMDWVVKLPNADNTTRLGTDETDFTSSAMVRYATDAWWAQASFGLAILGNPLMFANQDDAAVLYASAGGPLGPLVWHARGGGRLVSAKNPPWMLAAAGLGYDSTWFIAGAEGGVGLTPAAPSWQAVIWFGTHVPHLGG